MGDATSAPIRLSFNPQLREDSQAVYVPEMFGSQRDEFLHKFVVAPLENGQPLMGAVWSVVPGNPKARGFGKSTLMGEEAKLMPVVRAVLRSRFTLAGVLAPSGGEVTVRGEVSSSSTGGGGPMRTRLRQTLGLLVLSALALATGPALAQTVSNGPYYPTPAWDQTLACTALATCPRFIVLSNMGSAAALDRETGLVWERSPATTFHPWSGNRLLNARFECTSRVVGGRKGWRLPSLHELASLVDPANINPALPAGHPFTNVQSSTNPLDFAAYWSATTDAEFPTEAGAVNFFSGSVGTLTKTGSFLVWCVRGGMNADQY